MCELSVSDYISQQEALEQQARELMPWDPIKCTYSMGSIRQPVFACKSCGYIGVCYSCSIQCHTKCDLSELFNKRNFSCDCGTERQKSEIKSCRLRKNDSPDIPDYSNRYGQNFKGLFCICQKEYDAEADTTMFQCVLGLECNEEWYHDYCIMGYSEEPSESEKNKSLARVLDTGSFSAFICWKCVSKYQAQFERILGHKYSDRLISDKVEWIEASNIQERNRKLEKEMESGKRKHESHFYSIFLKEGYSSILDSIKASSKKGDLIYTFLVEQAPFLINDDSVYELPEDTNMFSCFEVASRALNTVDHAVAIDGALAYQAIKNKLSDFLRPFAEKREVVKEEDIKSFFESQNKSHET